MMFSRFWFRLLRLLVVVFPIGAGLFLTSWGVVKLNQATETLVSEPLAPYGVLAFGSEECEFKVLSIYMMNVLVGENLIEAHFDFSNVKLPSDSAHEEIFGFQIPYSAELLELPDGVSVTAYSNCTHSRVDVEVLEKNVLLARNDTSFVYIEFVASPELTEYKIGVNFLWRGLVIKQSFSTYDLIVPISISEHNVFQEHLPDVGPIECPRLVFNLRLPLDSEIIESIPPPCREWYAGEANRNLEWSLEEIGFGKEDLVSELIRVRLELRQEVELRGRLLFDSGLYIGVGVSLVFAGIHETLKIATESKKKGTE